jgi:hypothetical protein
LKKRRPSKNPLRIFSLCIGITIEIISIILVEWGIITLLPPNGNLNSFWSWLPLWAKFTLIVGIIILNSLLEIAVKPTNIGDFLLYFLVSTLFIILPMFFYFVIIWSSEGITIEKMLSLKKVLWLPVLYTLAGSVLGGLAGFFILKSRVGLVPGVISAIVIAALILPGIIMQERARAFQKNALAEWLQKYPQGKEVLDEFAM